MKLIYENAQAYGIDSDEGGDRGEWCSVGLFITNRGTPEQRRSEPILHGLLLQLLQARPALIRDLMIRMADMKRKTKHVVEHRKRGTGPTEEDIYEWTTSSLIQALLYCKTQHMRPFKALVVLDGLDELDDEENVVTLLKCMTELAEDSTASCNIFRVCMSSRSEQFFRANFRGIWRIEIHHHTRNDIRNHLRFHLETHPRFKGRNSRDVNDELSDVLAYVTENAHGVFLWVRSVAVLLYETLSQYEPLSKLLSLLEELPTDMDELYRHLLRRIPTDLRRRAFLMLEVILRARQPMTLFELFLVIEVTEGVITGRTNGVWPDGSTRFFPDIDSLSDPLQLQARLIASCRCLLEVSADEDSDSSSCSTFPRTRWLSSISGIRVDTSGLAIQESRSHFHSNSDSEESLDAESYSDEEAELIKSDDEEDTLELPRRDQYRGLSYGGRSLDQHYDTVQLLHRSAKDFLLKPDALDILFESDGTVRKPHGNGHAYNLLFAREWLKVDWLARTELRYRFDTISEVVYHAAFLETTMTAGDAAYYFPLLDEIDHIASIRSPFGETWPLEWFRSDDTIGVLEGIDDIEHWFVTFPAIAVVMDMRGYIGHRLGMEKNEDDRDHFLDSKEGRPLLHFSVYFPGQTPKPAMADLLLDSGADIHLRYEYKPAVKTTAIESLQLEGDPKPHLDMIQLLIKKGANPNSHYFQHGDVLSLAHPLLHLVAYGEYNIGLEERIELMHFLYERGADLNGADYKGQTFLDALYWKGEDIPPKEWAWLLRKGAKICKTMISLAFCPQMSSSSFCTGSQSGERRLFDYYYLSRGTRDSERQVTQKDQRSNHGKQTSSDTDDRCDEHEGKTESTRFPEEAANKGHRGSGSTHAPSTASGDQASIRIIQPGPSVAACTRAKLLYMVCLSPLSPSQN